MNRRKFLVGGGAFVAATLAGGAVSQALRPPADIPGMVALLEAMKSKPLATTAGWSPFKVFSHLAQSIELSMTGYPEMRSAFFRHSVGPTAFWVFSTAGAMRHPLTEAIPGAPVIADEGDVQAALARLQQALTAFAAHEGTLAPHFAYGALDKAEYARAHLMHIRDHLRLFDTASLPA